MSERKTFYKFLTLLILELIIVSNAHTIFPIMNDYEYFVDKNDIIHNNACPYRSVPWFTRKQSKYVFMKTHRQEFCNECFIDDEIGKLMIIHYCNIKNEISRLKRYGADEEYIRTTLEKYGYGY